MKSMRSRVAISAAILLQATVWAGCGGSKSHSLTIAGVKKCLVDAGFLVRGEGRPGAGQALAVRTPEKNGYAFAVVALFDTENEATKYKQRFTQVLEKSQNADTDYLKTLLQRRQRLVYGWTTRPTPADVRKLESCTQPR
jgi:hypothetical protein